MFNNINEYLKNEKKNPTTTKSHSKLKKKCTDLYNYKQYVFISNLYGVDIKIIQMFEMISM